MRASDVNFKFKIVIVGDSSVGKSSIIRRFVSHEFPEVLKSTVGVDFIVQNLTVDGLSVKLQIWDTAGQERFRTIITGYYRGADAVIFVFDKTLRDTFDHIDEWVYEVSQYAAEDVLRILVGNKSDMQADVSVSEAQNKANLIGIQYIDTSAKSDINVSCIFYSIARELINKAKTKGSISKSPEKILLQTEFNKNKSWCC
ncbi:hypothetical protein SteCoe_16842 [Stentor coeruleus]|uniref:Uncharacterized protein n=1 Tax=Stentor coeruleus TaxID=5963 RepID=A0A1R2C099_9CILI|nr:hypothetical protein SteCoe_16842 [Stentor coeruleus]